MAVPNYTYFKMKMPEPKGVITIDTKFQHAYKCDAECFQFTEALIQSEKIATETPSIDLVNDVTMVVHA
jgi:hypothetical protein